MILHSNCKINLGLNIVRKRMDGFHDIETVFYPLALSDEIEISVSADGRFRFSSSGLEIPGDSEHNLCVQAFKLLNEHFKLQAVGISLKKNVPMGSGLGGGSSNGAFTLKALNEIFSLGLIMEQMMAFASRLGSDCPFFIQNIPAFASGKGEVLEPLRLDLSGLYLLLVIPPVHISTQEAYGMITPSRPAVSLKKIAAMQVSTWKDTMRNDFEAPLCLKFPIIGKIKELLYRKGAIYSSMSGSGSAVYGLFNEIPSVEGLFPGCYVWISAQL